MISKPLHTPKKLKLLFNLTTVAIISSATACQPNNPTLTPQAQQAQYKQTAQKKITPKKEVIQQSILPTKLHKINHKDIQFNLVTFDIRSNKLLVADQPDGPGSKWPTAAAAAKKNNGIAAINAGFFTPEGKPLGIVISNGSKLGSYNKSSLGTGLFYHTPTGAEISRRSAWTTLSNNPPAHLLQSGPMLLENSKSITGLSTTSARPRSFIATDGKNHWSIGHAGSCSLSQLSKALTSLTITGFKATTALNLDGGRSSDLWVSPSVTGGSKEIRPFWNKPVRNFLILKSK